MKRGPDRRRALGRDHGVSKLPWTGKVVPVDATDEAYTAEVLRRAKGSYADYPRTLMEARERGLPVRFYRAGEPTLGEPVLRGGKLNMSCGRGTGHLGTGLYFFGTLRAAAQNGIPHRVEGGPERPFYTRTRAGAEKLHKFGKNLMCFAKYAAELVDLRRARDARDQAAEAARGTPERSERFAESLDARSAYADKLAEVRRTAFELSTDGPRLEASGEPLGVEDPMKLVSPRVRAAIERYLSERKVHPIVYYMRGLGYDGVIHLDAHQFEDGDKGNIWYPEV